MRRIAVIFCAVSSMLSLSLQACSSKEPAPSGSGTPAGTDAGLLDASDAGASKDAGTCTFSTSFGAPQCDKCMAATCCDQIGPCLADSACAAMHACAMACLEGLDAGGCYAECEVTHAAGVPLYETLQKCWFGPPSAGVTCQKSCL